MKAHCFTPLIILFTILLTNQIFARPASMYSHGHLSIDHLLVDEWNGSSWVLTKELRRDRKYRIRLACSNTAPAPSSNTSSVAGGPYYNTGNIYDIRIWIRDKSYIMGLPQNNGTVKKVDVISGHFRRGFQSPLSPKRGAMLTMRSFIWLGKDKLLGLCKNPR